MRFVDRPSPEPRALFVGMTTSKGRERRFAEPRQSNRVRFPFPFSKDGPRKAALFYTFDVASNTVQVPVTFFSELAFYKFYFSRLQSGIELVLENLYIIICHRTHWWCLKFGEYFVASI